MHCGRCDDHFLICSCTNVHGHGTDFIFKNLPPPPPNSTPMERLRRFCDLVSVSPSMNRFNAHLWFQHDGSGVVTALNQRQTQLRQMMEDYIELLRSKPDQLGIKQMAKIIGGEPLQEESTSNQVEAIANEARAAIASFLACDWSTVTRAGILLIQSAYETSKPQTIPGNDAPLRTVHTDGVAVLTHILNSGYSQTLHGWRLAMEVDREPVGTNTPIQSATRRDYWLRHYNSTHCQFCGKESGERLMICAGCRSVGYCDKDCQKRHWKFHKPTCKATQRDIKRTGAGGWSWNRTNKTYGFEVWVA